MFFGGDHPQLLCQDLQYIFLPGRSGLCKSATLQREDSARRIAPKGVQLLFLPCYYVVDVIMIDSMTKTKVSGCALQGPQNMLWGRSNGGG